MSEESLVGGDQHEAEGRQARIDRLFADAVERQMVEQRSFNRVIEEVGERLASLESSLRSLTEATSSQGLTLRAELQHGLERVANLDGGLGSSLEHLTSRLDERLEMLGQRLVAIERRVDAQEEAGEASARLAARIQEDLPAILEAPQRAAATTIEMFKPFLEDFRSEMVHEQREELTASLGQVRAVTSSVAEETEELGILAAALRHAHSEGEERLVALRDDLLARVEVLVGSGLDDIRDTVDRWAHTTGEEGRELRSVVEEQLDLALATLQERLAHVGPALEERLSDVLGAHEHEVAANLETALEEAGQRLGAAHEAFSTTLERLDDLAPDLDARIGSALDRAVETARLEARSSIGELQSALARLAQMQATFAGLEGSFADYLGAFEARLERERARTLSKLGEELAEGLSRRERRRLVGRLRGHQEVDDLRPMQPESFDDTPSGAPWRISARETGTGREVASQAPGTVAEPLRGRGTSGSSSLSIPPQPKPAPGMRPGLLTELLGEEPREAETETDAEPIPRMLRASGGGQRAEAEGRQETAGREPRQAVAAQLATQTAVERNTAGFACPTCDFIAKSAAGLASHRRRHA